ncbi:MAG: ribosome-binding factor A [Chloroflexi bacterium HGW-Chloroflexi-2]|jgi:ribosome-binding factor A|nr:MAG: ribosome-binding factor A [Chloroflexi bacterium HGW-Chloroflexi-2]
MPSKLRLTKIGDRIQQEISEMLVRQEISDPRLLGVTITDVKVDRELAFASVYVSALEGSERSKEILQGFESASSYIRKLLSMRIELRAFPRLRFFWDPTPERADRIEQILSTIRDDEIVNSSPTAEETDLDDNSISRDD